MQKDNQLIEKIDSYIRNEYKNDIKKMNGIICLFKTNINNLNNIQKVSDFEIKFKQADGYQEELLQILNKLSTQN